MKRITKIFLISVLLMLIFALDVKAETLDDLAESSGAYSLSNSLPQEVRDALEDIGLKEKDFSSIENLNFSNVITLLANTAGKEAKEIMPSACAVVAVLLLFSVFNGVFNSSSNIPLSSVLSVVSVLCIACTLLIPVTDLFEKATDAIRISADFMLAFVPVMTAILISAGQSVTGSGYSAMMIVAAEGVGQFFSRVISPLLSVLLTLGISTSVVPEINISSIVSFISKTLKWLMSFVFTIFTALLTIKSLFTNSVDNVSSRAVRYTMSSFIPVVGGALSEAYRTVHGSVSILKSGVGVFVILSIALVFLPILLRLLVWLFTLNFCKSISEISSLQGSAVLLSSVSNVLSLLLSIILCISALFIITTGLIITLGGAT